MNFAPGLFCFINTVLGVHAAYAEVHAELAKYQYHTYLYVPSSAVFA